MVAVGFSSREGPPPPPVQTYRVSPAVTDMLPDMLAPPPPGPPDTPFSAVQYLANDGVVNELPPLPPPPPVRVTVAAEHPAGTVTAYGPPGVEYDNDTSVHPIVLVDVVEVEVEDVDEVEVEDVEVEDVEVEDVEVEDVEVDVKCMFVACEVTLVMMLPLYVCVCFGWQLFIFPLGHAVTLRYAVPVIVVPG